MRLGKDIKERLCDEFKDIIEDENSYYGKLVHKIDPETVDPLDLLYWVCVHADWIGVNDDYERVTIDALNHIMQHYRAPNGQLLKIDSLGKESFKKITAHMGGYNPQRMREIVRRFLDAVR